jgi:hypothetical protein
VYVVVSSGECVLFVFLERRRIRVTLNSNVISNIITWISFFLSLLDVKMCTVYCQMHLGTFLPMYFNVVFLLLPQTPEY